MNVLIFFFSFIMIKIVLSKNFEMHLFSYTINLVTSLFTILPLVVMPLKKEWKLKRKTHTLNLSFHKTSTTNVHPNPSNSSTNPQSPYYSWATPPYQAHQLLLKLITCNMFVYSLSLSYNIPFFLLTTIHLIFFAKLKSSTSLVSTCFFSPTTWHLLHHTWFYSSF